MSLLKQDTIKKRQMNKLLESGLEFNIRENKEYKVMTIRDNIVCTNKFGGG